MSETATVLVERPARDLAILRLNRPAQLNALTATMFGELRTACEQIRADDSVRAVVITGSGPGGLRGLRPRRGR